MEKQLIYNFVDDDDLLRISNKIKEMEKLTAGEICVSIKEKRKFKEKKKSLRELAEIEFYKLGVANTRDKTGILIFLLLKDRKFYILADSGINEKVNQKTWDKIKDEIQKMFQKGEFSKGLLYGVDEVGKILSSHFPIKPDDTNELSNKVALD
ncbi:MAG: TPM domain-containing protein [Ignavibacteriaceae bacterium]